MDKIKKIFNYVVDTLIMLKSTQVETDLEKLDYYLEELEGDCYTFLQKQNIDILLQSKIINEYISNEILELRKNILEIPSQYWNVEGVKSFKVWSVMSKKATEILEFLNVNKDKIDNEYIDCSEGNKSV